MITPLNDPIQYYVCRQYIKGIIGKLVLMLMKITILIFVVLNINMRNYVS